MSNLWKRVSDWVTSTQIYRAIFRHGYEDTPRNRSLTTFSNVLYHLHPVKTRRKSIMLRYTWCAGGATLLLFVVLTVTGFLLMFYYIPDTRRAYQDMKDIKNVVSFGSTFRDIHRLAAHGMVITVWIHMLRVFLTGAYKPPREFNWVVGVALLVLTLLLSWTGYLLPWDQLAYWGVTVGARMAGDTPFLGAGGPFGRQLGMRPDNDTMFMLLGGTEVGQNALLRFYVLHCVVLPLVAVIFLVVHYWRVRKDGFSGPL